MSKEQCPFANDGCRYWNSRPVVAGEESGCFSDEHHMYWPRPDYNTRELRRFRNDKENKVQLCRRLHDEVHYNPAPEKDTPREEILGLIGEIAIDLGLTETWEEQAS